MNLFLQYENHGNDCGVMLQGKVASYDLFCMLLEREGYVQLAYKHAVSTIQPAGHVDLTGDWDGEDS